MADAIKIENVTLNHVYSSHVRNWAMDVLSICIPYIELHSKPVIHQFSLTNEENNRKPFQKVNGHLVGPIYSTGSTYQMTYHNTHRR